MITCRMTITRMSITKFNRNLMILLIIIYNSNSISEYLTIHN